jgi:predicted nuclease of predicted toxin-antitoxin system
VRFLVDANLSPGVADRLRLAGHDAVAVREIGLQDADDDTILDAALADDRVVVSHDTDFGTLLALRRASKPSFVLIRSADPLTTTQILELLLSNLDVMADDLDAGAIVTFARGHLRSRRLPIT